VLQSAPLHVPVYYPTRDPLAVYTCIAMIGVSWLYVLLFVQETSPRCLESRRQRAEDCSMRQQQQARERCVHMCKYNRILYVLTGVSAHWVGFIKTLDLALHDT